MATQLQGTGAEVVGVDLSEASLSIVRERAAARGLENITLVRGRLEDLPSLGLDPFDYVVSVGVLHHLPSPAAGLAAIRSVLKPGGGLAIMVYGQYGRTAIYQLQTLLRLVAPDSLPAAERIRIARDIATGLHPDHWAQLGKGSWMGEVDLHGDAGLFDVLLHSTDRAYTVPEVYAWLAGAGLRMAEFVVPTLYNPDLYGTKTDFSGFTEMERQAAAELLNGRIQKHTFFATPEDSEPPAPPALDDESAVPTWLTYDVEGIIRRQLNERPELDLEFEGLRFRLTLDPLRRAFLKRVDDKTPLGTIMAELSAKYPSTKPAELTRKWCDLYQGLRVFNLLGLFPAR